MLLLFFFRVSGLYAFVDKFLNLYNDKENHYYHSDDKENWIFNIVIIIGKCRWKLFSWRNRKQKARI